MTSDEVGRIYVNTIANLNMKFNPSLAFTIEKTPFYLIFSVFLTNDNRAHGKRDESDRSTISTALGLSNGAAFSRSIFVVCIA